jgi:1-acyl-sn-glycerol-3-phosphate acyltransferase
MIGALWYGVTLLACTVWYGGKVILAALVGIPRQAGGVYEAAAREWGATLLRLHGLRVEVQGAKIAMAARPCVFVANHVSFVDTWALVTAIPGSTRFVAKHELRYVPFFGWAMEAAGHIAIDRRHRDAAFDAYERAAVAIHAGASAIVFAEGTRSRDGTLQPFKKGPFVLVIAAQVPVVPVYVDGTFDILPKGAAWIRRGPIRLIFGDPLPTAGLTYDDRDTLSARCRERLLALRSSVDPLAVGR